MIIDYDHNPHLTGDQKLQSLKESVQMALNEAETKASVKPKYVASEISGLIDMFYPVGSYYETSDTSFDPNNAWGGVWSLETAGQVHVSAGTGYAVGSTGGNATKSYTPAGSVSVSVANHTLVESEIPKHTHGSKTLTGFFDLRRWGVSSGSIVVNNSGIVTQSSVSETANGVATASGNNGTTQRVTITATHEHNNYGGGGGHGHTGSTGSFTGSAASIDVMQPYVVVNRWHRTA